VLGKNDKLRPADADLRMFDNTELKTLGMLTTTVFNPKTDKSIVMEFYISKFHQQPILGSQACQQLGLLTVNNENILAIGQSAAPLSLNEINSRFGDVFEGYGKLEGKLHLEVDPSVTPVRMPLRKLPLPIKDQVKVELDSMVANGIIAPMDEPSEWISALLVVAKGGPKSGKIRICIDPKPLNKALLRSHYPMRTIDDILPELRDAKVFTSCDASHAFWHVSLDEPSSKLTTFESPWGRFKWLRMPFGISPAPEAFEKKMQEALSGLDGIACIADDILVFGCGKTVEIATADHDRKLISLLQRCREKGIRLNKDKFKLHRETVSYMGHLLTKDGLRADPAKIEGIQLMPPPTDKKGVQRLLGMATYLAKFVPNLSEVTAPIRKLLDNNIEFRWNDDVQGKAFDKLKTLLQAAPVLSYYDVNKEITIQCDSSQNGAGACLFQEGKPVAFVSKALTETQQQYSQIEKELLAVVFAMERFHFFVYGKLVTVQTDHRPLISIIKKSLTSAPRRLQRMLLRLQNYLINLVYVPGTKVVVADTLSRAFPPLSESQKSESERLTEDVALVKEVCIVASPKVQDII